MDALEALRTRRSVRRYRDEPVAEEIIEDIVDCARLAATGLNEQPWEFVVVTDAAARAHLASLTDHGRFIADAPVCIVVLCRDGKYYLEDGSAATQNLLVAARAHGLGSCWVAGDKKPYADTVRQAVGAPEGHRLVSLVPVGYTDAPSQATKRALSEVIHWERF